MFFAVICRQRKITKFSYWTVRRVDGAKLETSVTPKYEELVWFWRLSPVDQAYQIQERGAEEWIPMVDFMKRLEFGWLPRTAAQFRAIICQYQGCTIRQVATETSRSLRRIGEEIWTEMSMPLNTQRNVENRK